MADFARCPVDPTPADVVLLAHGGGGRLGQRLLDELLLPTFSNPALNARHDGAILDIPTKKIAFTTDSYVVNPLFFPGGNVGSLAVHGTVNDLSMCGARPLALSVGLIVEEGLPMSTLRKVVEAIRHAADQSGVFVATGDTKVVDRGKGDGVFVNTSGVGLLEHELAIEPASVEAGDAILLSGDVGRHGIAILAKREGLDFETAILSDSAPLWRPVKGLLDADLEIHCLRDLTRGGLAAALVEISGKSSRNLHVEHSSVPVIEAVRGACEILGLDPIHVANEGCFICILPASQADEALRILRDEHELPAVRIGTVGAAQEATVIVQTSFGSERILSLPRGEQLPRIC